jgi:hypothetical protein
VGFSDQPGHFSRLAAFKGNDPAAPKIDGHGAPFNNEKKMT